LPYADAVTPSLLADSPVLALDLGGTHLRTAVVAPNGTIGARDRRRTLIDRGADVVLADCAESLTLIRQQHLASGGKAPVAIGISAPGPLDPIHGVLYDPPNLGRSFWDLPIGDRLSAALGVPAALERDTHVAILAERAFGAGAGLDDVIYITVSTGIGGAVISEGTLMRGPDGVAGELGHITVDMNGPICGCGGRGHLERMTSGSGMARSAIEALEAGSDAPELARIAASLAPAPLEARHVSEAAAAGDPIARRILDTAVRSFAAAAVSIVDIFNPQLIIVGGGIALAWGEALLGPARDLVAKTGFRVARARATIVPASLGDDVGLIGALPLVRLALSGPPPGDHPDLATAARATA
jgi:glucokinase